VLLNREIGGNLSEIIDVVATTVRERFKLKAQVRALTSQGRFSALILSLLTPTLLAALTALNPEYLEPLYHTRNGNFALIYAACSTVFGYMLMRKIVDIKLVRTD
jgi:tight adherence protein B